VLRAVGLTPAGLRRLVMTEGATLGLLGAGAGVAIGSIAVYRFVRGSVVAVAGFHMPIVWPLGTALAMVVLGALSGAFAAYVAMRGQGSLPLVRT
jgi:ABC-type antimicrobial peptide transport system permease subunit